jgi:hypothetical protein
VHSIADSCSHTVSDDCEAGSTFEVDRETAVSRWMQETVSSRLGLSIAISNGSYSPHHQSLLVVTHVFRSHLDRDSETYRLSLRIVCHVKFHLSRWLSRGLFSLSKRAQSLSLPIGSSKSSTLQCVPPARMTLRIVQINIMENKSGLPTQRARRRPFLTRTEKSFNSGHRPGTIFDEENDRTQIRPYRKDDIDDVVDMQSAPRLDCIACPRSGNRRSDSGGRQTGGACE